MIATAKEFSVGASGRYRMPRLRSPFPKNAIGSADLVLGSGLLATCFLFFYHDDIWVAGWHSLYYIVGGPLEFYENCKHSPVGIVATYPPPAYLLLALWLYPLKLLGLITTASSFPYHWVYWLKALTTLTYVSSGAVFHKITKMYSSTREWSNYATAVYLAMPLALFSQFLFCQLDVFYVLFTLAGVLMFMRGKVGVASLYFGLSVTFKYFPALVYFPLLFLHEKRISRIAINSLIFILPTIVIDLAYRESPAFIEGVRHFEVLNRVYAATFDPGLEGFWKVYVLPAVIVVICVHAYFTDLTAESRLQRMAYYWLLSSILPFMFILWHPQWLIFCAPPLVLTTLLHRNQERFVLLDLVGMFLFVGAVSLTFQNNVDAAMFRGPRLGLQFTNWYWMADAFEWFNDRSRNVFYTGFFAYLVSQLVLKRELLFIGTATVLSEVDYNNVRLYFYVGLAIFLVPMSFVIHKDLATNIVILQNYGFEKYGSLARSKTFEQTFVATGKAIKQLRLPLETGSWSQSGDLEVKLLDSAGRTVAAKVEHISGSQEYSFHRFSWGSLAVTENGLYRIQVTSPTNTDISWWASRKDSYKGGQAIVDGVPEDWEFGFVIVFTR